MRLIFVLSMLWLLASPAQSQQTFTVGGVSYSVEKFLTANYPITLAFAPDGRLFYTEKISGNVRVVSADGVLQPAPVITLPVNALAEQGMLGIAIDPNFEDNGHIWVVHTNPGTTRDYPANRVVRFTERDGVGTDPEVMLEIPITGGSLIHNGGNLHFDREGRLYLTVGDYETPANAQNLEVMQGKIHRFDVTDEGLVPAEGNPLEGSSVYAYGLRNSWDFDFDTGESGYIYATENGDHCDDEINLILRGFHYGHGADYTCGGTAAGINTTYYVRPMTRFTPTEAPTGIVVYDNDAVPDWYGNLFFCVWNDGYPSLRMLVLNDERREIVSMVEIPLGDGRCRIDIEISPDGALYMTNVDENGGSIWRLTPH
ncbi:MAG: PQQ-dependent sugar dehydrogenase [Chloroflexi bacterium]|nr:PQQ-dependent sugar dehydrogenase [Chloroflexota bacterium]